MLRIAIIGLGPWGTCALERVVTAARHGLVPGVVEVHVIEPGTPGSGVYDVTQPDYLLLNNPCSELSLYPFATEADQPPYGFGLFDWAVGRGYRWVDERCAIDPRGEPIEPHHFLPRRLMGEYLQWFYRTLVAAAPANVRIVHHQTAAVDLVARRGGQETVHLADGGRVVVDHAIITSGHTANKNANGSGFCPSQLEPYPVTGYVDSLPAGISVAVAGMGLAAVDVVTALTQGRGGRFVADGQGLRYERSGREPVVHLYCRSGLPFTAKSVTGTDQTGAYAPVVCTPQALDALTGRANGHRRQVDVRAELLPLLFGEMYVRYYAQRAVEEGSAGDGAAVREQLRAARAQGSFDAAVAALAGRFGHFDPEALFFGGQPGHHSSDDYERFVYESLADDLREAEVPGGASPVKMAAEVFRIFREPMRSVVEQGGVSLDSYLDFNGEISSRIHRLVAGPPALRSRQLLALMNAGVVRVPYGPAPALEPGRREPKRELAPTRISSTTLDRTHGAEVDVVIRGYLEDPKVAGSGSPLLSRLHGRGRVHPFRYGTVTVGSVDLTADSHPIDIHGQPQARVWMFGVLTEGIRHFTAYIPSPKSRIRAFEDLGACVGAILG